jgi:hypothetical protein
VGILNSKKVNTILFRGYRNRWEYWLICLPAVYSPGLGFVGKAILLFRFGRNLFLGLFEH